MYAIKNSVQLIGSLVDKPVIKDSGDGRKSARFSILIEDGYYNARGLHVKEDQRHTLVAQGKIAALAEKALEKGMEVAIVGRLINRNFNDSRGERRTVTEVLVSELLILNTHWQEQDEYYHVNRQRSQQSCHTGDSSQQIYFILFKLLEKNSGRNNAY
jgi:single-strand DNA-binding protein